jgi:hypothetical protein
MWCVQFLSAFQNLVFTCSLEVRYIHVMSKLQKKKKNMQSYGSNIFMNCICEYEYDGILVTMNFLTNILKVALVAPLFRILLMYRLLQG